MLLKVNEVADRLRVTPLTVYRWISSGKLKALRIDGILRIEEETLDRFIGKEVDASRDTREIGKQM